MKLLALLAILALPLGAGASGSVANETGQIEASPTAEVCETCTNACPYGGSTEPSAHDCQASGGYVVGTPDCNDGGCANMAYCVCCEWYR